jgi:hypothetical protein
MLAPLTYENHESQLKETPCAPAGAPWCEIERKTVLVDAVSVKSGTDTRRHEETCR